jgi:hypothetical protein
MAACTAALLLGGAAWGQEPCAARDCRTPCAASCQPQVPVTATEATPAPYYYELPRILYPCKPAVTPTSNPALWARLFEAMAKQRQDVCAHDFALSEAMKRRLSGELVRLYRILYREGHYRAAEIVAARAVKLDPQDARAHHALITARMVAGPLTPQCEGAQEECVVPCTPAAVKGGCGSDRAGSVKLPCACGENCCCATAPSRPCACGESCPCKKKSRRQNVIRAEIRIHMSGAGINSDQGLVGRTVPNERNFDIRLPGRVGCQPVAVEVKPCCAPVPAEGCCVGPVQLWPHLGLRVVKPVKKPKPELMPAAPMMNVMPLAAPAPQPIPMHLRVGTCGKQIFLACPCLEACCDSITSLDSEGRVLLEGDVTVSFLITDRPAKIVCQRMVVNLKDGSYEVNPASVEQRAGPVFERVRYEQIVPPHEDR